MRRKSNLNLDGLNKIRSRVDAKVKLGLIATAQEIAANAAQRVPVDTGFLKESIHVTTKEFSEYEPALASSTDMFLLALANGKTPKGKLLGPGSEKSYRYFPESRPTNELEAWVIVGAVHGFDIEKTNKPFLAPAVNDNKGNLSKNLRTAFDGISVKTSID